MTTSAYLHHVGSPETKPLVILRSLGSLFMLNNPRLVGVMASSASDGFVVQRQLYTYPLRRLINDLENFLRRYDQVIATDRVTPVEPLMTARAIFIDRLIVKPHTLDPQNLPVRQGGVAEKTRSGIYGAPRIQLGMSVQLTIDFRLVASKTELVPHSVSAPQKFRISIVTRKLFLRLFLEGRVVTGNTCELSIVQGHMGRNNNIG